MEEQALINEVRNLLDHAQDSAFAGDEASSLQRLADIQELLNNCPELKAKSDQVIEEKLNPSGR